YRYADPSKYDDAWVWLPDSRRVRRVNWAFLETSVQAQTYSPNDLQGFDAKTELYSYRLLGEKHMLSCIKAEHVPETPCQADGGASICPERWESRDMYIVEATARRGLVPNEPYPTRILYIDGETWTAAYVDMYNRKGELMKNFTSWMAYRDRGGPD